MYLMIAFLFISLQNSDSLFAAIFLSWKLNKTLFGKLLVLDHSRIR